MVMTTPITPSHACFTDRPDREVRNQAELKPSMPPWGFLASPLFMDTLAPQAVLAPGRSYLLILFIDHRESLGAYTGLTVH